MGHQVDHLGTFAVSPPLSDDLRAWIDGPLLDDPWEAAEARGLSLELTTYCTWWTRADGHELAWTGAEKSYDGTAWLEWLLTHVLVPAGHLVHGTVHRFAAPQEGFVEASRIVADGTTVIERAYDVDDELPVQEGGPYLGDAFWRLSEGEAAAGQAELVAWLELTPLAPHPELVSFLEDTAAHWPDPAVVRGALERASGRTTAGTDHAGPDRGSARSPSLWDRLRGRG